MTKRASNLVVLLCSQTLLLQLCFLLKSCFFYHEVNVSATAEKVKMHHDIIFPSFKYMLTHTNTLYFVSIHRVGLNNMFPKE